MWQETNHFHFIGQRKKTAIFKDNSKYKEVLVFSLSSYSKQLRGLS
jgi:hypothetical protein